MDFEVCVALIEDTIDLAEEEGQIGSQEIFLNFITENIPEEILSQLNDTFLSSELRDSDGDEEKEAYSHNAFLIDVYQERFAEDDGEEEDHENNDICVLCLRPWTHCKLTRHHVYPKETHTYLLKRASLSKEDLLTTIAVCRLCHNAIHRFHSNKTLAEELYSIPLLKNDEKIASFCKWVSKQGSRNSKMK